MDGVDALAAAGSIPTCSCTSGAATSSTFAPACSRPSTASRGSGDRQRELRARRLLAKLDRGRRRAALADRPGRRDGRPSVLEARARKENGEVVDVRIGGASVMVARDDRGDRE
jgi:hypothetical protein